MDEDLSEHLERAHLVGAGETTFELMGGRYYYDLRAMTQTSPWDEGTERKIRRQMYDSSAD